MNRRNKRSEQEEHDKNEPWDQPIYEPDSSESYSRSSQHRQKRGNNLFLSVVLFILFLCVALPTIAGIWVFQQKNHAASAISTTETSQTKTTKSSESATSSSESSSETTDLSTTESSVADSSSTTSSSVNEDSSSSSSSEANGDTITVLAGEGPNQIAARAGITVDKLLELNGMTLDNYFFSPGQQVKIK